MPEEGACESSLLVFPSVSSSALSSCMGTGCWGSPKIVVDTTFTETPAGGVFNDKDWIAVDRTSQASGLYLTYIAFNLLNSRSTMDIVRCSYDLSSCSG